MAVLPVSYWAKVVEKKPSYVNPCPPPASRYRIAGIPPLASKLGPPLPSPGKPTHFE